ncbi:hypothetical protein [Halocatena pleomorpha]|uniref:hypothetical protein n=1 Tax=Halocatena pleomorpha TaxID=1785090 RepID=UPI00163B211B|nr:hypothetical protein [Halocatena pleomorpha]
MPLTPFHFGPTLLFGYLLRRRMDLGTFLVASVILDVRAALAFLGIIRGPTHGPLHDTYLGATAVALVFAGCVLLFARRFPEIARRVSSRPVSAKSVTLASVSGTWLHVTLDVFTHSSGMQPFYPLPGNPLYGLVGPFTIYASCVLAFLLCGGIVGVSVLRTVREHGLAYYKSDGRIWKTSVAVGVVIGVVVGAAGIAGTAATIDMVSGIGSPDVTVERVNDTHAAVTWTTEKPTRGHLTTSVSHQCGPAWGNLTTVNRINDSSVTRSHLVIAPIYDLQSQANLTNVSGETSPKWYQVTAIAVRDSEMVGTSVVSQNLSETCR